MKIIRYPKKEMWPEILARPVLEMKALEAVVRAIVEEVEREGDRAVRRLTEKFDRVVLDDLRVSPEEFAEAEERVPADLKEAIGTARANIEKFHAAQVEVSFEIETFPGVFCRRKAVPIERVGLYVPGGTTPLFSTVLMLAVPAGLAGCGRVVICTPPAPDGRINDVILYTAAVCGVSEVFRIGGAQAIAALACGTETVPRVFKIFGPGNQYVTAAKQFVAQRGVAIDMPAGPSEIAVFADGTAVPAFVAADLLSQAEHGTDSQVLLVSTSEKVIGESLFELEKQLAVLPRRRIAAEAIKNSKAVLVADEGSALELLNEYAAEHLILAVENAGETAEKIINAGSVFLGNYSCEAAGDYASGTNHTLPTNGFAKAFSGVSLESFQKKITFQQLTAEGIRNLGPVIERLAAAEQLEAHKNAVTLRLKEVTGDG